jgi:hypothetical protein
MKHLTSHKYQRKNIGRSKEHPFYVYQCTLPTCTHYVRESLIFGRMTICWTCDKEFLIMPIGTRPHKRKPICQSCWNVRYGKGTEVKNASIEEILKSAGAL